jgi:hypothetical protein
MAPIITEFRAEIRFFRPKLRFRVGQYLSNPPFKMGLKQKGIMIDRQIELGLSKVARQRSRTRRNRYSQRARWWFARMRQVVDNATDWPPVVSSTTRIAE